MCSLGTGALGLGTDRGESGRTPLGELCWTELGRRGGGAVVQAGRWVGHGSSGIVFVWLRRDYRVCHFTEDSGEVGPMDLTWARGR